MVHQQCTSEWQMSGATAFLAETQLQLHATAVQSFCRSGHMQCTR
jgi:hypothetical protein